MMIRPFTLFCVLLAGTSGMILYAQKHKTTVLDHKIAKIVYDTEKIKSHTAILRTEWTLLNQPDRLKTLTNDFLPQLHPLAPTQFIQMASLSSYLPPVQKEQEKDKTREQLVQSVANDHKQDHAAISPAPTPAPAPAPSTNKAENHEADDNDDDDDSIDQQNTPSPSLKPKSSPHPTMNKKQDKPVFKKQPHESHDLLTSISSPSAPKKMIKPSPHPKPNDTEARADNTVTPPQKPQKKPAKVLSTAKKPNNRPPTHPTFSIADSTNTSASVKEKENTTPPKKPHSSAPAAKQKDATSVKTVHYEVKKKHYHSESAFGDDSDDLPAPVPFSQ